VFLRARRAPYYLSRKAIFKVRTLGRSKESSLKDYVPFRQYYFAKRLLLLLGIGLIALSIFGYIYYDRNMRPYKKFYADQEITYTGNVKIYHSKELKELLYEGYVKEGIYHDEGKLYYDMAPYSLEYAGQFKTGKFNDEGEYFGIQGHTLYKGEFKDNLYEGIGSLYTDDQDNELLYEGEFKKGQYFGVGTLYGKSQIPVYEGNFKNGLYWGDGILYNAGKSTKAYEGGFTNGQYSGKGKKYDAFERLEGEGDFLNGEYNGQAILYDIQGNIKYEGQMRDDSYHGEGVQYDPVTLAIIYEGTFQDGLYDGFGRLSNELGELVYEGGFTQGLYHGYGASYSQDILQYDGEYSLSRRIGDGRFYDNLGALLYEGGSTNGTYDGFGTLYDPSTGDILFKGYFDNGIGDILLYIGKTEETIIEKLGTPDDTLVLDKGNILLLYQSLGFGLHADYERRTETDMIITGVRIYGDLEVFGIKREMTASIIESILGAPKSRNLVPEEGAAADAEPTLDLLTFVKGKYQIDVPYASSETESQYIAVELLE